MIADETTSLTAPTPNFFGGLPPVAEHTLERPDSGASTEGAMKPPMEPALMSAVLPEAIVITDTDLPVNDDDAAALEVAARKITAALEAAQSLPLASEPAAPAPAEVADAPADPIALTLVTVSSDEARTLEPAAEGDLEAEDEGVGEELPEPAASLLANVGYFGLGAIVLTTRGMSRVARMAQHPFRAI